MEDLETVLILQDLEIIMFQLKISLELGQLLEPNIMIIKLIIKNQVLGLITILNLLKRLELKLELLKEVD